MSPSADINDKPQSRSNVDGIAAPFRHPVFRRTWLASLLSNLGILIHGGGMGNDADDIVPAAYGRALPVEAQSRTLAATA